MDDDRAYIELIRQKLCRDFGGMYRAAGGIFAYPFLTPGSGQYADVLWDWDSWLSNVALRQILLDFADKAECERAVPYERGCVQNYLKWCGMDGWIPPFVARGDVIGKVRPADTRHTNMHKPVLAQHAAFLVRQAGGDAEWLRDGFYSLQAFLNRYRYHSRHACGLYYWQNDFAIGVDNDPCTFFRPAGSSGSIFLNCLMYRELLAMVYLCSRLHLEDIGREFQHDADDLKEAVRRNCWDERDGFYYSVDLNLLPVDHDAWLHQGMPRGWDCLIQRIGVWSGFLAMWSGIATPAQAERMVREHYRNPRTFHAEYGVRSLSKMEKMYSLRATGNPSNWLGPVWGIANYMVYRSLARYGYRQDAEDLVRRTIRLFGRDLERFGTLHENYQPDNGEPILNPGFQNWNYLVVNMIDWLEGRPVVEEF